MKKVAVIGNGLFGSALKLMEKPDIKLINLGANPKTGKSSYDELIEKERGITINESIKLDNSIMLNSLRDNEAIQETFKSGRESRRERRKQERKNRNYGK